MSTSNIASAVELDTMTAQFEEHNNTIIIYTEEPDVDLKHPQGGEARRFLFCYDTQSPSRHLVLVRMENFTWD